MSPAELNQAALTQPRAPQPFGVGDALRWIRPWQLPVAVLLLALGLGAFGLGPGLLTAVWLAAVSPVLGLVDLRLQRLPNVLVLPGCATLVLDLAWQWALLGRAPWAALLVVGVVGALLLGASVAGGLGMGDVKLAIVQAGCLGLVSPSLVTAALMIALLVGGGVSAVLLVRRRADRKLRMPFGPFLLLGFWTAVLLAALARAM